MLLGGAAVFICITVKESNDRRVPFWINIEHIMGFQAFDGGSRIHLPDGSTLCSVEPPDEIAGLPGVLL